MQPLQCLGHPARFTGGVKKNVGVHLQHGVVSSRLHAEKRREYWSAGAGVGADTATVTREIGLGDGSHGLRCIGDREHALDRVVGGERVERGVESCRLGSTARGVLSRELWGPVHHDEPLCEGISSLGDHMANHGFKVGRVEQGGLDDQRDGC